MASQGPVAMQENSEEKFEEKARKWNTLNSKRYGDKRKFGYPPKHALSPRSVLMMYFGRA